MKILSTSSSFGEDPEVFKIISEKGLSFISNPFGRTLTEEEGVSLIQQHKPIGLLAGTGPLKERALRAGHPRLKVISRIGAGWDNVDCKLAEELGIKVCRTADAPTQAVVELTIGLFLDLSRMISLQDRLIRRNQWEKKMGYLVHGKVLGILGCGRIGKGVALAMRALGCRVQACDLYPDIEWLKRNGVDLVPDILSLFRTSDLLSIHADSGNGPKSLIDEEILAHAKRGLLLVNVARGYMVDEPSLITALQRGTVRGAALDVFEREPYVGPLSSMEQVILTPHIGSHTRETRVRMETEAIENLLKGLQL